MGKIQDTRQPSWEAVAKEHATKQHNNIPAEWRLPQEKLDALSGVGTADEGRLIQLQAARKSGLLSDRELDITENHTARDLLPKLAARELTSVEVTVAFCKRAALAQQLVRGAPSPGVHHLGVGISRRVLFANITGGES